MLQCIKSLFKCLLKRSPLFQKAGQTATWVLGKQQHECWANSNMSAYLGIQSRLHVYWRLHVGVCLCERENGGCNERNEDQQKQEPNNFPFYIKKIHEGL